ncbi:uncharacterized protein EAF01_010136 [Botrytis porri]|uniref:uncharacterized protein n=1 Tax=Botrytis porri TaxID=87229 RepID=UPI0018FFAA16|nr:uncharacterized protein EAF01_010136 [Botrytis porri]KAF7894686.1 hypothetical protein EAF01_010136 [Botrytis porri]
MSDPEIELQQIKESQDRTRARLSARKRQYGLLKKAEQFRRVANIEVAIILYDPTFGEYCIYRSKDDDSWPPSMKSIRECNPVDYLPSDFESAERMSYSITENRTTGKRRRKLPDICLKRKKPKHKNTMSEKELSSSPQQCEDISGPQDIFSRALASPNTETRLSSVISTLPPFHDKQSNSPSGLPTKIRNNLDKETSPSSYLPYTSISPSRMITPITSEDTFPQSLHTPPSNSSPIPPTSTLPFETITKVFSEVTYPKDPSLSPSLTPTMLSSTVSSNPQASNTPPMPSTTSSCPSTILSPISLVSLHMPPKLTPSTTIITSPSNVSCNPPTTSSVSISNSLCVPSTSNSSSISFDIQPISPPLSSFRRSLLPDFVKENLSKPGTAFQIFQNLRHR